MTPRATARSGGPCPTRSIPWLGLAVAGLLAGAPADSAAQVEILSHAQQLNRPINYGLPDRPGTFTFCRLRYDSVRRQRKSGWWDDYPASDFNFLNRFEELSTVWISRWSNGDPGFAQLTITDPELFRCPFIKMQNAADYDFRSDEIPRLREYLLKGGFLWMDDNWTDEDWTFIRRNLERVFPDCAIVDLPADHPLLKVTYRLKEIPQIPSIESWRRSGGRVDEFGAGPPHIYAVLDPNDRIMVLVTMNSDTSDSWEREGDNPDYFYLFSPLGYGLAVNVAVWAMTH